MAGKISLFGKGIPYEVDFRRLSDAFPKLVPGTLLTHNEMEQALGQPRTTCRYRAVISAWLKKLFHEQNIAMKCERGVGYVVLKDAERVGEGHTKFGQSVRSLRRTAIYANQIPVEQLDEIDRKRTEHLRRATNTMYETAAIEKKRVALEFKPTATLPQPRPRASN